jgi:hypothetical protein
MLLVGWLLFCYNANGTVFLRYRGRQGGATKHSVHWTPGILPHFQAFSSLRVFPAPKQSPRQPQRQQRKSLGSQVVRWYSN